MFYDFSTLDAQACYKLMASTIVPRPIAFVTTVDGAGTVNAAPYSFFNMLTFEPPLLALGISFASPGVPKDTAANIRSQGEFVVNLVSSAMAEQMNIAAVEFPPGASEVLSAGLQTLPAGRVAPPRLAASPASFECRRHAVIPVSATAEIVLGQVLAMHIDDAVMEDAARHYVAAEKMDLIARMHGKGWYARTTDLFDLPRISLAQWEQGRTTG